MESSSLSSESGSQPVLCSSCFFRNNVLLSPRAPPTGDYPQTSPSRKFSDDKRAVREAYGFRFRLRFVVCRLVEIFLPYEAPPPDQFTWNTTKGIGGEWWTSACVRACKGWESRSFSRGNFILISNGNGLKRKIIHRIFSNKFPARNGRVCGSERKRGLAKGKKKDDAALSSQPGFLRGCKLCSSYRPLRGSFHSIRYRPASVYLCYELLRESFRFYVD